MTVNELIEQLKNYPGDMRVLTLGYEGGYSDVQLDDDDIVFNFREDGPWYYGPHESDKFTNKPGIPSLVIRRTNMRITDKHEME